MKANAPEKIYCTPTEGGFYLTTTKPEPPFAEGIEYTRTDAFIEKACMWLLLNADDYIVDGVEEHSSAMRHDFIESFKKAMEGE